jgi:hypothetical protein
METKNKHKQLRMGTESKNSRTAEIEASDAPFSAHWAFVVQFRKTPADLAGRAEHIASAQATLFSSEQELVDFFRRILQANVARDKGGRSQ